MSSSIYFLGDKFTIDKIFTQLVYPHGAPARGFHDNHVEVSNERGASINLYRNTQVDGDHIYLVVDCNKTIIGQQLTYALTQCQGKRLTVLKLNAQSNKIDTKTLEARAQAREYDYQQLKAEMLENPKTLFNFPSPSVQAEDDGLVDLLGPQVQTQRKIDLTTDGSLSAMMPGTSPQVGPEAEGDELELLRLTQAISNRAMEHEQDPDSEAALIFSSEDDDDQQRQAQVESFILHPCVIANNAVLLRLQQYAQRCSANVGRGDNVKLNHLVRDKKQQLDEALGDCQQAIRENSAQDIDTKVQAFQRKIIHATKLALSFRTGWRGLQFFAKGRTIFAAELTMLTMQTLHGAVEFITERLQHVRWTKRLNKDRGDRIDNKIAAINGALNEMYLMTRRGIDLQQAFFQSGLCDALDRKTRNATFDVKTSASLKHLYKLFPTLKAAEAQYRSKAKQSHSYHVEHDAFRLVFSDFSMHHVDFPGGGMF